MLRPLLALATLLALLGPAAADHCTEPGTSEPAVEANGYYVVADCALDVPGCDALCRVSPVPLPGVCAYYVYEESNAIAGLQRQDELADDTCHGLFEPDTLIL